MSPSARAWTALTVGVVGWDVLCPPGETLSAGFARGHRRKPWLMRALTAIMVCHLLDVLPKRLDLIHLLDCGMVGRRRHREHH